MTDAQITDAGEGVGLAATYDRVAAHLVGRERELTLVLAAVAAGRDLILEGPPGTSKSTLLRAITAEWGIPLVLVEGNADLTPSKMIGHHNPARVLREDYGPDNFVDGPLLQAMREGDAAGAAAQAGPGPVRAAGRRRRRGHPRHPRAPGYPAGQQRARRHRPHPGGRPTARPARHDQ